MPNTSRGYPYPALTDQPNGPGAIQALAQAINDDLNSNVTGTTWVQITNISSNYTASVAQCLVKNGELQVRGAWTRKSGVVTVGESVFGLPAGMFPTSTGLYRIPFVSNDTVSGYLALSTAGIATVVMVSGTTSVIVPATVSVPMN